MDKSFPRIVFMGTPAFAVASLEALVDAGFNVVAVITAPDKPAGRGMKLQESAVKQYAVNKGIDVLQPLKLKNEDFLDTLKSYKADLQIVVAFRMLPEVVWDMPAMGTINVHGSLLPQYRGAAPINWAVINGDKETGVTTFKLKHAIDTGDILLQRKMPIGENENAGDVHDRMMKLGAEVLVETVNGLIDGTLKEKPQDAIAFNQDELKHAPKIFKETGLIDWKQPAKKIHDLVRGLAPFPGAYTMLDDKMIKIFESEMELSSNTSPAGMYKTDGKTYLKFSCGDGFIFLKEVQLEGKKRMRIEDFLRGHRFE